MSTIKQNVKNLLIEDINTRKDDNVLYAEYVKQTIKDYNFDNNLQIFCQVLKEHSKYNLPNYSTIIRARRLLQVENPSLIDAKTKTKRTIKERKFLESIRKGEVI